VIREEEEEPARGGREEPRDESEGGRRWREKTTNLDEINISHSLRTP
jgi:hypothetical protein